MKQYSKGHRISSSLNFGEININLKKYIPDSIGDYQIINLIANPGFTELYLGHHRDVPSSWENLVTIKRSKKEYRRDMREYIRNEAEILSKLKCIYSPRLIEWDKDNEEYLIFQYLTGKSLDNVVKINRAEWVDLTLELVDAIDSIHTQGIVHRDFKPGNILMGDKVTVIDFSIAAEMVEDCYVVISTGTPSYSPPEVKKGLCNPEIDIYGLGATMFSTLTGKNPITMEGLIDTSAYYLMYYFLTRKNPLMEMLKSSVDDNVLRKLISDCLSEDPIARPYTSEIRSYVSDLERRARIFVQGKTHFLLKDQMTIGSSSDCDIQVDDNWGCIDDNHATVFKEGDSWYILDNNSRNGTFIKKGDKFFKVEEIPLLDESYLALGHSERNGPHISLRFRT
jgi:serine/threonine protein kinase